MGMRKKMRTKESAELEEAHIQWNVMGNKKSVQKVMNVLNERVENGVDVGIEGKN
jgi:hypothetical protein